MTIASLTPHIWGIYIQPLHHKEPDIAKVKLTLRKP